MDIAIDIDIAIASTTPVHNRRNCFSFDAGYGSTHMARIVGQKKAREIWFLCKYYSAAEALDMGLVNTVVPLKDLELVRSQVGFCVCMTFVVDPRQQLPPTGHPRTHPPTYRVHRSTYPPAHPHLPTHLPTHPPAESNGSVSAVPKTIYFP